MSATCTTKTISSEAPTIIDEEEIQPNDVLFYGSSPKVAHRKHVGTIAFRADLHRFVDEFQRCPANVIAQGIVQHVQKEYGKGSRFLKRVEFADVVQYRLVGWRNTWFVLDATSAMAKIEKMVLRIKPQTWQTTNLNGEEATYHSKSDKPDAMFDNAKNDSIMLPGGGSSNGTDAVTNCADENTCKDSGSNDNSSGILYVSFVGGHPSNPIVRVQLPGEGEELCGNTSKFHLPYSGPNEALEAAELLEISLKQANIIDINPLPPRSSSANTNAHTSTIDNSVDDSRAQRHRARKDMIKSIYRLLKNQPDTWPQQWKAWFADLPRPQLSSFVAKIENMMYKRSKSFDAHIDMDTLPKRLYLVLTELDNKRRTLASADVGRNESDTHEEVIV